MNDTDPDVLTTLHARRAVEGDVESVSWLVRRLSPLLITQARYRIGKGLRRLCDPEDLVNDTWAVALPRLPDLDPRGGRFTPVILRFLSTILLRRLNALLRKHIYDRPQPLSEGEDDETDIAERLAAETRGVVSRILERERRDAVTASTITRTPGGKYAESAIKASDRQGVAQARSPVGPR